MPEPDLKPFFLLIVTDRDRLMLAVECPMSDAGHGTTAAVTAARNFHRSIT